MKMRRWGVLALASLGLAAAADLDLELRSRVEAFKGSGDWQEVRFRKSFPVDQTAILICDMWDNHWCKGAVSRVVPLAQKMSPLIDAARAHGVQIIHAPSETMDFYKDLPQRLAILAVPRVEPPPSLGLSDPPLPIDDSSGGCDTPDKFYKAWTREIATLHITGNDVVSDSGPQIYSFLRQRGIRNLLFMGVHTNMCVLNRTFAIKKMTNWGIRCVLVRDLTDTMYNPKDRPYVSHSQGTELVVEHIEKYWCPTTLSGEVMRALQKTGGGRQQTE
ncbi:MAG TPA: isochorismatase family protein [Bryobacteraceae bacterium]|nr:isochorismatase family protein [Bryobacteraceae bacterium]